ncbi:MAG: PQQ-binding-like beta-propeller repeat protein [Pseudomonadota bacterium]
MAVIKCKQGQGLSAFATLSVLLLAACGQNDAPLVGEREDVGLASEQAIDLSENQALPITLPQQAVNAAWTHPGGNALHRVPHPALSNSPSLQWSANIGEGDGRRQRINARPVVADGRIYAVDAAGVVTATSTSGAALWTRDLTPSTETRGQGGSHGLAFGGGALYVNTPFGEVVALDPETGSELWSQDIDAQGGASSTYLDGRVYVAARDSVGWAINAETGRVDWQINGTPSGSGYLGGAGPAVTEDLSIFPFSSGELVATFRRGGLQRWNATVLGRREGAAYASISDVAADPIVAGGRVYAANPAGRLVALNLGNGERLWTALVGTISTPSVAGGSIFLVSDQNRLTRLNANTGETIWAQQLPLFVETRERRQKTVHAHLGPVLAGERLYVASSDGLLRGFDPVSGALTFSADIPGGAATAPVVAGGTLYVVSKRGQLLAFR